MLLYQIDRDDNLKTYVKIHAVGENLLRLKPLSTEVEFYGHTDMYFGTPLSAWQSRRDWELKNLTQHVKNVETHTNLVERSEDTIRAYNQEIERLST